ncbi:MAG: hypothetical protein FJX76_11320, partial [Armatimonadetes bacterium]|nr:hypothetical protein [Armatimonadota bacterium]
MFWPGILAVALWLGAITAIRGAAADVALHEVAMNPTPVFVLLACVALFGFAQLQRLLGFRAMIWVMLIAF